MLRSAVSRDLALPSSAPRVDNSHASRRATASPIHRRLHVCPVEALTLVCAEARALLPERFRAHLLAWRAERRRLTASGYDSTYVPTRLHGTTVGAGWVVLKL